ncbi:MAG: futalosine nucleosidase [Bacteroidetes bacterium]|jgi:futalosine hydrolase|nr:futalosine nucleosidase [Bacteroidota bacterium]MDF2452714.1 futalosine nucleosidase [Bacteroidota bacterium]
MKILIVSATHFEVKPLLGFLGIALPSTGMNNANMDFEEKDIQVLITGVGMVNTAVQLGRYLDNSYDLVVNVGVCGAFDKSFELGQLVRINEDILSELGAEDGEDFLTYDRLNLPGDFIFSESYSMSDPLIDSLRKAKGITVNTVHGKKKSIEKVKRLFQPDVESMEGAAFFAACHGIGPNYIQIRAVSNYVEKRDKSKWQMALAIENLNAFLINFIKETTIK